MIRKMHGTTFAEASRKPDEWRAWVDSIASGDRADAHRQMMRRLGIKREHIRHQTSPAGDVMVLVWEGSNA
jgi:hypothetical protein